MINERGEDAAQAVRYDQALILPGLASIRQEALALIFDAEGEITTEMEF